MSIANSGPVIASNPAATPLVGRAATWVPSGPERTSDPAERSGLVSRQDRDPSIRSLVARASPSSRSLSKAPALSGRAGQD
jgi:hypothetical protein